MGFNSGFKGLKSLRRIIDYLKMLPKNDFHYLFLCHIAVNFKTTKYSVSFYLFPLFFFSGARGGAVG